MGELRPYRPGLPVCPSLSGYRSFPVFSSLSSGLQVLASTTMALQCPSEGWDPSLILGSLGRPRCIWST